MILFLVIRNDRAKVSQCHTVEDVAVDINHLNGLLGLQSQVSSASHVLRYFLILLVE